MWSSCTHLYMRRHLPFMMVSMKQRKSSRLRCRPCDVPGPKKSFGDGTGPCHPLGWRLETLTCLNGCLLLSSLTMSSATLSICLWACRTVLLPWTGRLVAVKIYSNCTYSTLFTLLLHYKSINMWAQTDSPFPMDNLLLHFYLIMYKQFSQTLLSHAFCPHLSCYLLVGKANMWKRAEKLGEPSRLS